MVLKCISYLLYEKIFILKVFELYMKFIKRLSFANTYYFNICPNSASSLIISFLRRDASCLAFASKLRNIDTIVIAGMGGALMMRILSEGQAVACAAERLVLQPQSELYAFRCFLMEHGYQITAEDMGHSS